MAERLKGESKLCSHGLVAKRIRSTRGSRWAGKILKNSEKTKLERCCKLKQNQIRNCFIHWGNKEVVNLFNFCFHN